MPDLNHAQATSPLVGNHCRTAPARSMIPSSQDASSLGRAGLVPLPIESAHAHTPREQRMRTNPAAGTSARMVSSSYRWPPSTGASRLATASTWASWMRSQSLVSSTRIRTTQRARHLTTATLRCRLASTSPRRA
eukprot:4340561-Prymnesium_polylepis.1